MNLTIKGNEDYIAHNEYVWNHFVKPANASIISIVAHSRGGDGILALLRQKPTEFMDRVCALAFTDSVHSVSPRDNPKVRMFIETRAKHWVRHKHVIGDLLQK